DVVRVETSRTPDIIRFLTGTDGTPGINRSGVFNSINFSRRSVAMDLARPEAQELARRLVRLSDIVCENFTVGNMEKFRLGYEELRKIRPDIIMLSGTPLGQTGPYAKTVGWGPTTQAFAGMCHLTGYPGGYPCGIGGTWPDFAVGVGMAFFIMAALHHRERTGEGQYLDLSMAEMVTTMLPEAVMEFLMNGRDVARVGNRDDAMAPHGVYPCAGEDAWIAIAAASDAEFAAIANVLGVPSLATDRQFVRLAQRLRNVDLLDAEIAARTRNFARDDLVAKLRERGVATGPVYNVQDLMADRAFQASGMLSTLRHAEVGERVIPVLPVQFSGFEPNYYATPNCGEHTGEVLSGLLQLTPAEIQKLREDKVLL
ncbi:MAG TPA: CoA transferase, partial [Candidatus Binataceae bacterium]|nr:CoA transferase [Candidatus Binataceae bacterium]